MCTTKHTHSQKYTVNGCFIPSIRNVYLILSAKMVCNVYLDAAQREFRFILCVCVRVFFFINLCIHIFMAWAFFPQQISC